MSMMTVTGDSEFDVRTSAQSGWFEKLVSAVRVSAALQSNARPQRHDLETLGIAHSFENYLAARG